MALDFKKVQKPARKLRKLVKKIRADASPELVHDFRTRSRRLEAFGWKTPGLDGAFSSLFLDFDGGQVKSETWMY